MLGQQLGLLRRRARLSSQAVVEPSAQAVHSYLRNLGASLKYPVALDTAGRVADGHEVQDQPWFA